MGPRRAGGYNYPIELVFLNGLLDLNDAGLGAGVEILLGKNHPRQRIGILRDRCAVEVSGYIGAAIADKNADPQLLGFFSRFALRFFITLFFHFLPRFLVPYSFPSVI